jgi:hypothetical protein
VTTWKWLSGLLIGLANVSQVVMAGTCCHTPTIWTFKNLDAVPVTLECRLEKSAAWSSKPLTMSTKNIAPGAHYVYTWDSGWYADGMGMIPGQWACKPVSKDDNASAGTATQVAFTTDWGENITISWTRAKATVARAD